MNEGTTIAPARNDSGLVDVLVPDEVACLAPLVDAGVLGAAEVHLAAWVARCGLLHATDDEPVILGVAMACWAALHGHACADLDHLALAVERERPARQYLDGEPALVWPDTDRWLASLRAAAERGLVRVVGNADTEPVLDSAPLVLCGRRLYLQRHWVDECTVAASLRARAGTDVLSVPATLGDRAARLLERLLPASEPDGSVNQQRLAADLVFRRNLALVVGGPGTGKTYSVARLLMAMMSDAEDRGEQLRIALAAPTGKAAARLTETIRAAVARVESEEERLAVPVSDRLTDSVKGALIALEPSTIHRLLGPLPTRRQRFAHHATNPIPFDIVLIDETSMVSTPLIARLVEAVPPTARLVLIGDPDQLESVELGAALGDIVVAAEDPLSPLAGHAVRLQRGHRFEHDSPIALLADSVREQRVDDALALLRSPPTEGLTFSPTEHPSSEGSLAVIKSVVAPALEAARDAAVAGDASAALDALAGVRVLCAHRLGEFGVAHWNEWGERWTYGAKGAPTVWYPGRPLLITRNDFRLGLANGDTGVVVLVDGRPQAAFADATAPSGVRLVDPVELEDVDTAYAMTIHKSQGSEYDSVVLVLPPASSPLIGRELVYTAITRAKRHLTVVGSEAAMRGCINTPARRMTGLAASLAASLAR